MNNVNRRRVIVAGAAGLLAPSTAGCLGDGDIEGEEELAVGHVRFVTGQPQGYREYHENEEATYDVDDVVWIYLEPTGLETEDNDDGEVTIDVDLELTIRDPDGEIVEEFENEINRSVPEDSLDELYFYWNFQPSTRMAEGEYTAELGVVDNLAGARAQATSEFILEQDTDFTNEFETAIQEELVVDIDRLEEHGDTVELTYDSEVPVSTDEGEFEVGFIAGAFARQVGSGWGVERLIATVNDGNGYRYEFQVSAEEAQAFYEGEIGEEEFTIITLDSLKPADFEAFFQRALERETDVLSPMVSVPDGLVELEYESEYAYGQRESIDEIGDVAVVFALVIGEGWDVEGLDATFVDANEDRFTFDVETDTAQDWIQGRISGDEYGERVLESVEVEE